MSDLLRWNENLDHPSVGGQPYVDAMQTRMRLTSGRTITYALGLEVVDYDGVREVGHGGSTAGYRTYLARYPDQRVSVAVWCNDAGSNAQQLARRVADLVLTKPQRAAAQAGAAKVTLPAEELARWAAVYRDPHTDQAIALTVDANGLTTGRGRGAIVLAPQGGARFHSPVGDATFSGTPGHREFFLARTSGDTSRFEEVSAAPSTISTADYVGTYASDELDVKLVVAAKEGKLVLRRRPADEFELRPVYVDDFATEAAPGEQGIGTLRFARDASGKVAGFSIYAGRVLDVRFTRVSR
jgi:beta-lactamase family protein